MSHTNKSFSTQAIIGLVGLIFGILVTILTGVWNVSQDYTQTKDDVGYIRGRMDSLNGVPEALRSVQADLRWMKDSASSNNARLALLEREQAITNSRLSRVEQVPGYTVPSSALPLPDGVTNLNIPTLLASAYKLNVRDSLPPRARAN